VRVIGGRARGRKLKMVPGSTTRPMMDRVKENLFNILGDWVAGTRWLDLFGGTGQVGIEALSRGAADATFVDSAWPAINTLQENLAVTGLAAGAKVIRHDALGYLRQRQFAPFDVVYVAPPQYKEIWLEVLRVIDEAPADFLADGGLVIVQIDPSEYTDPGLRRLIEEDRRKYGRTLLLFYEAGGPTES
jgi:16S rRNA (guanine(966)-N(2))-methyltransferase RsmD